MGQYKLKSVQRNKGRFENTFDLAEFLSENYTRQAIRSHGGLDELEAFRWYWVDNGFELDRELVLMLDRNKTRLLDIQTLLLSSKEHEAAVAGTLDREGPTVPCLRDAAGQETPIVLNELVFPKVMETLGVKLGVRKLRTDELFVVEGDPDYKPAIDPYDPLRPEASFAELCAALAPPSEEV